MAGLKRVAVAGLVLAMLLCPALSFPQRPGASDELWLQEIMDHDGLFIYISPALHFKIIYNCLHYDTMEKHYYNLCSIILYINYYINCICVQFTCIQLCSLQIMQMKSRKSMAMSKSKWMVLHSRNSRRKRRREKLNVSNYKNNKNYICNATLCKVFKKFYKNCLIKAIIRSVYFELIYILYVES